MFRIPISGDIQQCSFSLSSNFGYLICKTHLIIWNKVPIHNCCCFEAVVRKSIYDVKNTNPDNDPACTNIPLVMGGDWAPTLPLVAHGNHSDIAQKYLCSSFLWNHVTQLFLKTDMPLALILLSFELTQF